MKNHKKAVIAALFFIGLTAQAQCENLLAEAKQRPTSNLVIAFDGLGTAEFGMGVLRRRVVSKIEERCPHNSIASQDFYYSKNGAKKAMACALAFQKEFGRSRPRQCYW